MLTPVQRYAQAHGRMTALVCRMKYLGADLGLMAAAVNGENAVIPEAKTKEERLDLWELYEASLADTEAEGALLGIGGTEEVVLEVAQKTADLITSEWTTGIPASELIPLV